MSNLITKAQTTGLQAELTNPVTGTGTTGQIAEFNGATTIVGANKNTAYNKEFSTTNPLVDGTAAPGSSGAVSDGAHVHPTDTSRAADNAVVHLAGTETVTGNKTFTGSNTFGGAVNMSALNASQILQTDASKNIISSLALPSNSTCDTQSIYDVSTKVANCLFVKSVQTLKPVLGAWFTVSPASWYQIGYINMSSQSNGNAKLQSNMVDATNGQTTQTNLSISLMSPAGTLTENYKYWIDVGNISALRPDFSVYRDGSYIYRIYVNIKNNTMYDVAKWLNLCYLFTEEVLYAGTGTNPTGVSGYSLRYNTATDEAGLIRSKTALAAASFWGTSPSVTINFSISDNKVMVDFTGISVTATSNTNSVITLPANTIPSKYCPSSTQWARIAIVDIGTWVDGAARVFTDGSVIITRVTAFAALTDNLTANAGQTAGFTSFSMEWVAKQT